MDEQRIDVATAKVFMCKVRCVGCIGNRGWKMRDWEKRNQERFNLVGFDDHDGNYGNGFE